MNGERQAYGKLRADARLAFNVDLSVQVSNDSPDHVHADAPARLIADFFRRGEAREVDQLDQLGGRHRGGTLGGHQTSRDPPRLDFLDRQSPAIVFDLDHDRIAPGKAWRDTV